MKIAATEIDVKRDLATQLDPDRAAQYRNGVSNALPDLLGIGYPREINDYVVHFTAGDVDPAPFDDAIVENLDDDGSTVSILSET